MLDILSFKQLNLYHNKDCLNFNIQQNMQYTIMSIKDQEIIFREEIYIGGRY